MEAWQGTETIILSGAPQHNLDYLKSFLCQHSDARIVCVDGGVQHIDSLHIHPDLLVGDFDSCEPPALECEIIRLIPEKDDTDTMHALQVVLDRGCTSVWIVCATGGRMDHMLSNLSLCEYAWERGCTCRILDAQNELSFLAQNTIRLQKSDGYCYFSIIPLDQQLKGLSITGAKYPLQDAAVHRSQIYTISNEISEDYAEITLEQGRAWVIRSHD